MKYREYITEIYWRLIYSFIGFTFGSIAAYSEKDNLLYALIQPLRQALNHEDHLDKVSFVFLRITEAFTSEIYLSVLVSLFAATPILWVHIWFFLAPGLYKHEQRSLGLILIISWTLLLGAFYFSNNYLLPQAWSFFLSFANLNKDTNLAYLPSLVPYINISLEIFFGILLTSQLPILFFLIIHWNWFDAEKLVALRPWVVLVFLFWAGLISPPDLYSQVFIFIPLYFFYESAIFLLTCKKLIRP